MPVKHARDVPASEVAAGDSTSLQVLLSEQEAPNFAIRRFTMKPGGGMPNHTNTVEHGQYVLEGHARIAIDADEFEVRAGDVVFIPAGVPHWYTNIGEEDFVFLCIIPTATTDQVTLLDEKGC
ncbi:MAG: cupin domain-containing protein [Anaerolineales bacterium]|nr:cupin domain-containing protein [Anaerolineales bacterium]